MYDLDYLTDKIPLLTLFQFLKFKEALFDTAIDKTIFDLDDEKSPVNDIALLLKFDTSQSSTRSNESSHTYDMIDIVDGKKTWMQARTSWRSSLRFASRAIRLRRRCSCARACRRGRADRWRRGNRDKPESAAPGPRVARRPLKTCEEFLIASSG